MQVESLLVYPIKGMKGTALNSCRVELRGLEFDRRWMLVDVDGVFLSQRKVGKMATIWPSLVGSELRVRSEGLEDLCIPLSFQGALREVTVWRSCVEAAGYSSMVDEWFSDALGMTCSLVRMPEETIRETNPDFSLPGDHVSFADGFPLTLATTESLRELNSRLAIPVPMNRFRPNVVVSGVAAPWAEESWSEVCIGSLTFRMAKPCGRCQVTTIDQTTGLSTGDEPLRTLSAFRKKAASADFSINIIPESVGEIRVGDEVQVLTASV